MPKRIKKQDINGWNEEEEQIIKGWGDQASCYNWLHNKSHERIFRVNALFTIPVIIISTLAGAASIGSGQISDATVKTYVMLAIGFFNILGGIISTIAQFLRIAEINEGHRVATIAWDKFARNIKIQMAKNPMDRRPATEIIKVYKEEFDRLVETSPKIKNNIVDEFNLMSISENIIKPEITGLITETLIFDRKKIEWEYDEVAKNNGVTKEDLEIFKRKYFETNGKYPSDTEINYQFPNYSSDDSGSEDTGKLVGLMIDSSEVKAENLI
jgi:hypothetical protein